MNRSKRTCFLLYLLMQSQCTFASEHLEAPHPQHVANIDLPTTPEIHLTIDIPERPENPEPHTPADIKRLKIKVAAVTAVITALIGAGVSLYIGLHNCN